MKYEFSFEKLEVWKCSVDLSKTIYQLTNNFPENEKYGLVSQLRRASVSIASNLAEGTSRQTNKDKAQKKLLKMGFLTPTREKNSK